MRSRSSQSKMLCSFYKATILPVRLLAMIVVGLEAALGC